MNADGKIPSVDVYVHICMCAHMYVQMHVHLCICLYVCVYLCPCVQM